MIIVLMGVMGSGKTTIGALLAERMGVPFVDADDHHPAGNKEKMRAGNPLDDDDRKPWLEILNGLMKDWHAAGKGGVLACSALKEKYRGILRAGLPDGTVRFVLLDVPKETLAGRIANRRHEYMKPDLLASQLEALEPPQNALVVVNDRPPREIAQKILQNLS